MIREYTITPDELLKLIKSRRSYRKWNGKPVEDTKLEQIIESGVWAPSGANDQRVRFLIIKDNQTIKKLCRIKRGWFYNSFPTVIIMVLFDLEPKGITNNKELDSVWFFLMYQEAAAAIQNMLLMIETLGLSGCWVSFGLPKNKIAARELLEIGDYLKIAGSIFLGYSDMQIDVKTYKHQGRIIDRRGERHAYFKPSEKSLNRLLSKLKR